MALWRTLSNSSGVVLSIRLLTLRISDVFCVLTPSQVRSFSQSRCQQQLSHHTIFPPPMGPFNKWVPIRSSAGQNNTGTQTFIQLWSRTCEGRKKNIPLIPLDFSFIAVLPNIPDFWKRKKLRQDTTRSAWSSSSPSKPLSGHQFPQSSVD